MGHLLDGKWTQDEKLKEIRDDGRYVKFDAIFRGWVSADGSTDIASANTDVTRARRMSVIGDPQPKPYVGSWLTTDSPAMSPVRLLCP